MSVEEAAKQTGIPIEEIFQYVTERAASVDTLNFQLRLVGQGAIKSALTKLHDLAAGDAREGKDFESTDLEAAKALAKFGIDAIKLAKTGGGDRDSESEVKRDLFDIAAQDPWRLKKIE